MEVGGVSETRRDGMERGGKGDEMGSLRGW